VTDVGGWAHLACGLAAAGAGAVNAVAGGGTLISFPALTALGVPSVNANATNTVALCPGYVGGAYAQRAELARGRDTGLGLRAELVVAALAGVAGSVLLVLTSDEAFRAVVPYLILLSALLLAVQPRLAAWLRARPGADGSRRPLELTGIGLAAAYGGYFGAGLGIMLLAVLGLFGGRTLSGSNAVKSLLALAVNLAAAAFLATSGTVEWTLVAVMAPASLIGGQAGGTLVRVLPAERLRPAIVVVSLVVAVIYLTR
jgi:uncharacterized membrane protein YfcA